MSESKKPTLTKDKVFQYLSEIDDLREALSVYDLDPNCKYDEDRPLSKLDKGISRLDQIINTISKDIMMMPNKENKGDRYWSTVNRGMGTLRCYKDDLQQVRELHPYSGGDNDAIRATIEEFFP